MSKVTGRIAASVFVFVFIFVLTLSIALDANAGYPTCCDIQPPNCTIRYGVLVYVPGYGDVCDCSGTVPNPNHCRIGCEECGG